MKKLLLCLLIFWTSTSYAQTTQVEYNYIVKGYKVELESGLDPKKGYIFKDIGEDFITTGSTVRKCTFKALHRTGQAKPCAIMCIYSEGGVVKDYLCIPSYNSSTEIWNQALEKFKTYSDWGSTALIWGMARLAAFYAK